MLYITAPWCRESNGERATIMTSYFKLIHDDVVKWKHFPRYWPFVRGIHRSPVNFPHKGQWRGALMFSLICARINGWVNNREAGDLRQHMKNICYNEMSPIRRKLVIDVALQEKRHIRMHSFLCFTVNAEDILGRKRRLIHCDTRTIGVHVFLSLTSLVLVGELSHVAVNTFM